MSVIKKGPWSEAEIETFLQECLIPLRLACVGADGFPRVVSVWFLWKDGRFHSVSHQNSQLVALLRSSDKVGFEVAPEKPPYYGLRGQGIATLDKAGAGEVLDQVLEHYLGGADSGLARWLQSRRDEEVLISVAPARIFSWDYRERMGEE